MNNQKNYKILLVEDDPFLSKLCALKFKKAGFEVMTAFDGEEALKIIDNSFRLPDVILLDLLLPTIDGFDVLARIRSSSDSGIKNLPVVILSNLDQEEEKEKARELGVSDYLVKSQFTMDEIVLRILDLLKNKIE